MTDQEIFTMCKKLERFSTWGSDPGFWEYAGHVLVEVQKYIECKRTKKLAQAERHLQRAYMHEGRTWFCKDLHNDSSSKHGGRLRINVATNPRSVMAFDNLATGLRILVNRILLGAPLKEVEYQHKGILNMFSDIDIYGSKERE